MKKILFLISFFTVHGLNVFAQTAETPWPMFRHDTRHTGMTPYSGPASPTVRWVFRAEDGIASSAAIGPDGTIYIGAGWRFWGVTDSSLYAINPDGSLKWRFKVDGGIFSSPAVASDGTIYFGSLDQHFYAVEDSQTSGRLKWRQFLGNWVYSSPTIGPDGTIYVGGINYQLHAFHPNGTLKWKYSTASCMFSSPAIGPDSRIYVGSKDEHLYALADHYDSARLVWKYQTGLFYDGYLVDSSPAVGADGTVYVGTDPYGAVGRIPVPVDSVFHAINPDGSRKWVFAMCDGAESSPAIGPDGTVYIGSHDGNLYAISDEGGEGRLKWAFRTGGVIDASPVVDGCGTVYVGSRDSTLYAINPDGNIRWVFPAGERIEASAAIDDHGILYIGTFGGDFYALGQEGPDAGIVSIDLPDELRPNVVYSPMVTMKNYRMGAYSFSVSCSIDSAGTVIKRDTLFVSDLRETTSGRMPCGTFRSQGKSGTVYTVTAVIGPPGDTNGYNDTLTAQAVLIDRGEVDRGDINRDGKTNVLDIVRVVQIIIGSGDPPTALERWLADCSGDEQVDVLDVLGVVNVILGNGTCAD